MKKKIFDHKLEAKDNYLCYTNFPKFSQDETRLAIFGNSTAETVLAHKLAINVFAPTPENPSLVDAIKKYITLANKKR